jgi:hypothetical protein
MASYCTFEVRRWQRTRTERQGGGLGDPRTWPEVRLGKSGECLGCEREGPRQEVLRVHLKDSAGAPVSCDVDEARWRGFREGMQVEGTKRLVGGIGCGDLTPP